MILRIGGGNGATAGALGAIYWVVSERGRERSDRERFLRERSLIL